MNPLLRVLRSLIPWRRSPPPRPQLLDLGIELKHPARVPDGMLPRPYPPRGRERASMAGVRRWLDACAAVSGLWEQLHASWLVYQHVRAAGYPTLVPEAEKALSMHYATFREARNRALEIEPWTPTAPAPEEHPFQPSVN